MSWNPFAKQHIITPKTNVISRLEEKEFEKELKRVERLQENTKSLYKGMKAINDAVADQMKFELKMVNELSSQSKDTQLKDFFEAWTIQISNLNNLISEQINSNSKNFIDPLKKYSQLFPSAQQAINKRNQLLFDYSKAYDKVDKYQSRERTGSNIVKLENSKKMMEKCRKEYEEHHNRLKSDLPKLYQSRSFYIQPCLQILISNQINHATEAKSCALKISNEENENDFYYLNKIEENLQSIKALSITDDEC